MPTQQSPNSDAPTRLRTLSDVDRAAAISKAVSTAAGLKLAAEIQAVSYRGYLGRRGPFKEPTRLVFELFAADDGQDANECVAALRSIPDQSMSDAIANALGKLAGEAYEAEIAEKRFMSGKRSRHVASFTALIAKSPDT